jgi:hypothetical protein
MLGKPRAEHGSRTDTVAVKLAMKRRQELMIKVLARVVCLRLNKNMALRWRMHVMSARWFSKCFDDSVARRWSSCYFRSIK